MGTCMCMYVRAYTGEMLDGNREINKIQCVCMRVDAFFSACMSELADVSSLAVCLCVKRRVYTCMCVAFHV